MKNKFGMTNIILAIALLILWSFVFIGEGMLKVVTWSFLITILPMIGFAQLVAVSIILIFKITKRRSLYKCILSIFIGIVMVFPGLIFIGLVPIAYPENINKKAPAVTVLFPLKEETVVGWGGDGIYDNRKHSIFPSEKWAYDLVMNPHSTGESKNKSYGIWGKEVMAPLDGVVVSAANDKNDILPMMDEFESRIGNHVYIKLDSTGTYIVLEHLQKGSITVKVGDKVKKGEVIGRVGNSGTTSEPHLHIHHQKQNPLNRKIPFLAEGLPLYFEIGGKSQMPKRGDVINP